MHLVVLYIDEFSYKLVLFKFLHGVFIIFSVLSSYNSFTYPSMNDINGGSFSGNVGQTMVWVSGVTLLRLVFLHGHLR